MARGGPHRPRRGRRGLTPGGGLDDLLERARVAPHHYLDHAATTFPRPPQILARAAEFLHRCGVTPGRSSTDAARLAEALVATTRRRLTELVGGTDPDHLIFTANASDALNILIQGLVEPGDHVVSTNLEHNSVLRPLRHLERAGVITLTVVDCGRDGVVDPEALEEAFRPATRVVVMSHASNVVGTIQPVAEVGRRCRQRGVLLVVDAAQTLGALAVDVEASAIDAVAFTGHKSLLAPPGVGGLYLRPGVAIRATRWGGTGVRSAHPFHLEEMPYRLEVGTPNLLGIAALLAALEYRDGLDPAAEEAELTRAFARLEGGLSDIPGVELPGPRGGGQRRPTLVFNLRGLDPARVGQELDVDHGVASRTGLHCAPLVHRWLGTEPAGAVRLSLGHGSTLADVEAALTAVAAIAGGVDC